MTRMEKAGVSFDILDRYLAKECLPDEAEAVENWISLKDENRILFEAMKEVRAHEKNVTPEKVDAAWDQFRLKYRIGDKRKS